MFSRVNRGISEHEDAANTLAIERVRNVIKITSSYLLSVFTAFSVRFSFVLWPIMHMAANWCACSVVNMRLVVALISDHFCVGIS